MFDIDPQRPALRLGTVLASKPAERPRMTSAELLAIAERQMEEAIKAWVSASMDYASERLQSQPISAARPVGDGMMRYEPAPTIFRANGEVERYNQHIDRLTRALSLDAPLG